MTIKIPFHNSLSTGWFFTSRVLGEFLWAAAVVVFLGSSISFHFLIDNSAVMVKGESARNTLVILRVILLDGLFLVMGITLGVCIIIVSSVPACSIW